SRDSSAIFRDSSSLVSRASVAVNALPSLSGLGFYQPRRRRASLPSAARSKVLYRPDPTLDFGRARSTIRPDTARTRAVPRARQPSREQTERRLAGGPRAGQ